MTSRRLLGALGLAAGLALAPTSQAQAPDQDPGSAPTLAEVQTATVTVDDQDAGPRSVVPVDPPFAGSDQDAEASLSLTRAAAPTPTAVLDNGRAVGAVALSVSVVPSPDTPLRDGRSAGAVAKASPIAIAAYDGPLDDGRGAPAAEADAADLAPRADASAGRATRATLSTVRPNPAPGRAVLTFRVDEAAPATVVVYDLTGRRVAVAYDAVPAADREHRVELDLASVAAGTYVAVLSTGGERLSRTFQVVR